MNPLSFRENPPSYKRAFLFPTAIPPGHRWAFVYNGSYLPVVDTLPRGEGFWLKFRGAQLVGAPGTPMYCVDDSLRAGWNMIGSVSVPVPLPFLWTTPPMI